MGKTSCFKGWVSAHMEQNRESDNQAAGFWLWTDRSPGGGLKELPLSFWREEWDFLLEALEGRDFLSGRK